MNPVTALPPEQLKARARVAGMKRQAALERLRKARWAFDKNPNEATLATLRMWTITVLQHEHEMCGFALEMRTGQAADMAEAHAEGMHDGLPREGCPECNARRR